MRKLKIINVFFLFLFISCFTACDVTKTEPKYIPDVKDIKATVELIRFDQAFFTLDTTKIGVEIEKLKQMYPEFTQGFLSTVLGVQDSAMEQVTVKGYLSYPDARYTYDTVQKVFKDLTKVQQELNELATYYQYYFPDAKPLTKAFAYLSEYHGDRLAVIENGFVGLPLDMALGAGYPPYTFLKIPMYDQRTCNAEHLVAKAADAIAQNLTPVYCKMKGSFLIDMMLYYGKTMYLTDILLPNVADSLKFGFTTDQMDYCAGGELPLYEHLSKQELMYSNESRKITKYVTKGPFNPDLDLPNNSGAWLGYKMILSFVKHHKNLLKQANPKTSARELDQKVLKMVLEENDPQKFLTLYKPPKN